MAAKSAAEVTAKQAVVVSSRTVPEGLAAMLRHNPGGELDAVAKEMETAMRPVQTGEITTASRDAEIDGVKVKIGQIIGLHNGKLAISSDDLEVACQQLLEKMGTQKAEIITVFYGEDLTQEEAQTMGESIHKAFPKQEIEIHQGGQPHYQFIFSVE
jgi:hypothetical protein